MSRTAGASTPRYRHHKPSGQAVVTIDGRDFYLGTHGTKQSREDYDRLIGEWLANGRRLARTAGCDLTINEWHLSKDRRAEENGSNPAE